MKKKLQIILTGLMVLSYGLSAKSESGIYMSTADFKNNKLTFESGCARGKHSLSIHLHDFFWNMPYITITEGGKKNVLKKSDVYGFRDCDNEVYRFYKNTEYRIAEAGNIYVYTQERNIAQSKGYKVINDYFFSVSASSEILPLTICNLKNAYSGNDKFLDLLDQYFGGSEVNEYDNRHKTFKINYVFAKSMK